MLSVCFSANVIPLFVCQCATRRREGSLATFWSYVRLAGQMKPAIYFAAVQCIFVGCLFINNKHTLVMCPKC